MKSVTNSKRAPFQVKRIRARRGLAIELGDVTRAGAAAGGRGRRDLGLQDARRPEHAHDVGRRARAEAEDQSRRARPRASPTTSRASDAGCRRASRPSRRSPLRLLTRAASARGATRCRLPPSFRHSAQRAGGRERARRRCRRRRRDRPRRALAARTAPPGQPAEAGLVRDVDPAGCRRSGRAARRAAPATSRSSRPSLS